MQEIRFVLLLLFVFLTNGVFCQTIPRLKLTWQELTRIRYDLPGQCGQVHLLQASDHTYVAACQYLFKIDIQSQQRSSIKDVEGDIIMLHKTTNGKELLVCWIKGNKNTCSYMNPFNYSLHRNWTGDLTSELVSNKMNPSILIDDQLYYTNSGTGYSVGIHRSKSFGKNIWPSPSKTEQIYVGLAFSRRKEDLLQNRLYAFHSQKNVDNDPDSEVWLPRVTQVCLSDLGGTKSFLQFRWTSILSARLSCGDHTSRLYFTHLVDVTVLEAPDWRESRVYALFLDGWNKSAVCVYTMDAINNVFTNSNFKGHSSSVPTPRPGQCSVDSQKLSTDVLKLANSEMEDWVKSFGNGRPLLVSHFKYRHLRVDRVHGRNNTHHTVLYLSLAKTSIHKILVGEDGQTFNIAELEPFSHGAAILNMLLVKSSKLYVSSSTEVVQLDLNTCRQYGDDCVTCLQSRDPYCGWTGTVCGKTTETTVQEVSKCKDFSEIHTKALRWGQSPFTQVPASSKHFFSCPTRSRNAQYVWRHNGQEMPCVSTESQCLLLIPEMSREHEGTYTCMASEGGYNRTLVTYAIRTDSGTKGLIPSVLGSLGLLFTLTLLC